MPSQPSLVSRIRNLLASLAVVGAIGTGTALLDSPPLETDVLRVAAFNIQVFGESKLSKDEVMEILVDIAQEFDLLVVQEIRDASEKVADEFLARINEESDLDYAMHEGPRLGRSVSKEQYVFYYVPGRVQLRRAFTLPDPEDQFEREPLVATFHSGNFDFTLVVCHIKPEDAEAELEALRDAALSILEADPSERDVILLGDFNADGRYLDESERLFELLPTDQFEIVITNDMDTMTTSDNTYDRIALLEGTSEKEYIGGSAQPFRFDLALAITDQQLVRRVSDHYPVFADFRTDLPDDD